MLCPDRISLFLPGEKMNVRKELNARLYNQKTEDMTMPHYRSGYAKYVTICNGETETVSTQLKSGTLALECNVRILSKNSLKNAVYHFVLSASAIAEACMEAGMGHDEAYTLSDLYILKADCCTATGDVHRLYGEMCLDFTERMQEIRKESVISLHIRRCIDHIYENLGADLSVKSLAREMKLSPAYLSKLFRDETGVSLKRFVKEAKVDTAQNLLRYSDLTCLEISVSLGFSSQSAFISVFKEITGMTPKAYREQNYFNEKGG